MTYFIEVMEMIKRTEVLTCPDSRYGMAKYPVIGPKISEGTVRPVTASLRPFQTPYQTRPMYKTTRMAIERINSMVMA